ncbi:MAG: response regulator [Nitrospinales bacterium]
MSDGNPISAGAKILLVDDSLDNIDLLRKALEPSGYNISVATNGETALKIAPYFLPDLILLDVMMPGIDGFETCRRLKENAALRDVSVIFITARIETKDVIKGFKLGGLDYITKPFNRAVVVARVEMHLERNFLIRQRENLTAELQEASRKLEMLETGDTSADLLHPGGIIQQIEFEIVRFQRGRKPFSLIRLGVDPVQATDAAAGSGVGEAIWTQVDRLLKTTARKQDVIAHKGKGMFLLFLPETNLAGAVTFAEKLRRKLENQVFSVAKTARRVTASAGVCAFEENMTLQTCLETAEQRVCQARQAGGNQVVSA